MPSKPELFDHQKIFLDEIVNLPEPERACLYYKTGAGKSLTALLGVQHCGYKNVVVIAPPSTHMQWIELGEQYNMAVECMSHAKFRMKNTKLSRQVPVIADEFHLFGGHKGQGWKKLDMLARNLQAPLFLLSATPNYNDAERVYCVKHILEPHDTKGGYLQFLYTHCTTEQNPFGHEPKVTGFKDYPSAAEFLASMKSVFYLPDDVVYTIEELSYAVNITPAFDKYNYNARKHRIMASQMEKRYTTRLQGLVNPSMQIHGHVMAVIESFLSKPVLMFCNSSVIAAALSESLESQGIDHQLVTGKTPAKQKDLAIDSFRKGETTVLIGTATLATGTDGLDKVCDTLLIIDDTDDDALRRQLIGRIMPRGKSTSTNNKRVIRLVPIS